MERAAFLGVFFVAYTIQTITGFAGNMLAMPPGIALLGFTEAAAVLNFAGVLNCGAVAIAGWKSINWKEFGKIIVALIAFMCLGIWIDTLLSLDILLTIYGLIVLAVGVKNLIRPQTRELPTWALFIVVALAGIVQGMFISGGAFLVIYAVQKLKDKDSFRSTLSLIWTVLNFIYSIIAFVNGSYTLATMQIVVISLPIMVAATVLGIILQKRISQQTFLKFTYVLLVIIGLILLFT